MAMFILVTPAAATSVISVLIVFFTASALRSTLRGLGRRCGPLTGRVAGAKNGVLATHDWNPRADAALLVGETEHFDGESESFTFCVEATQVLVCNQLYLMCYSQV